MSFETFPPINNKPEGSDTRSELEREVDIRKEELDAVLEILKTHPEKKEELKKEIKEGWERFAEARHRLEDKDPTRA